MKTTEFIQLNDTFPKDVEENETIWLYNQNTGFITLGCMIYEDGWLWAVSNSVIYSKDNKIISECECDDDYEFTHYCKLPNLPTK